MWIWGMQDTTQSVARGWGAAEPSAIRGPLSAKEDKGGNRVEEADLSLQHTFRKGWARRWTLLSQSPVSWEGSCSPWQWEWGALPYLVTGLGTARRKCGPGKHGNGASSWGHQKIVLPTAGDLSSTFPWLLLRTDKKIPAMVHSSKDSARLDKWIESTWLSV